MKEIIGWHIDTARLWLKENLINYMEIDPINWTWDMPVDNGIGNVYIVYVEDGFVTSTELYFCRDVTPLDLAKYHTMIKRRIDISKCKPKNNGLAN